MALACSSGLAACGGSGDDAEEDPPAPSTATVYSSLPLQGPARPHATEMVRGIDLALAEAGGRAGGVKVAHRSLDDASADEGRWTAQLASANARQATQDDRAMAYIGDFDSGASAVSMPILNEGGVAQVAPGSTAVALTTEGPGSDEAEPEVYYPTDDRHFARIVPDDAVQGAALAQTMVEDGCTSLAIANDGDLYGTGLAAAVAAALEEDEEVEVVFDVPVEERDELRDLARRAETEGADCALFAGTTANGAVRAFEELAAALPDARLYGGHRVADPAFLDPQEGGIPERVAERVKLTAPYVDLESESPELRRFTRAYRERHDEEPGRYAAYGYEAMRLVLDAIDRASAVTREDVMQALLETQDRESVLGTYSIDENGDTTLDEYGAYTIEQGELVLDTAIEGGD